MKPEIGKIYLCDTSKDGALSAKIVAMVRGFCLQTDDFCLKECCRADLYTSDGHLANHDTTIIRPANAQEVSEYILETLAN